jgi:hypothetical protein
MATERVIVGTNIMPIYFRQPSDFAAKASFIHEVSNGRFRFGVGVSHALVLNQLGHSLSVLSDEARASDGFFVGNMIPTCISDDREAAAATNRRTLTPSASEVREGIDSWFDAGMKTPVIVPSSASGNQVKAFEEFFAIWD